MAPFAAFLCFFSVHFNGDPPRGPRKTTIENRYQVLAEKAGFRYILEVWFPGLIFESTIRRFRHGPVVFLLNNAWLFNPGGMQRQGRKSPLSF